MKIHEYQGKQIFAKYGIPVPKGIPAFTADEAEQAAKKLIDEAMAAAQKIASKSAIATKVVKEAVNRSYETTLREGLQRMEQAIARR